jgi:hypothetical protein
MGRVSRAANWASAGEFSCGGGSWGGVGKGAKSRVCYSSPHMLGLPVGWQVHELIASPTKVS